MEVSSETMVEEREELMISPTGGNPTLRNAHFLKPSVSTTTVTNPFSHSLSSLNPTFDPHNCPFKANFNGWRFPVMNWTKWVHSLRPQCESVWKKAGIYDAILSTTHEIRRYNGLAFGVSERWCPETKSFGFVWGEATITLEDVMVLGGFGVSGQPVFHPLVTTELKEIERRLVMARKEIVRSTAKKGCQRYWLKKFMGSGSDIEHEAFLVFWLSKFVFPNGFNLIRSSVYSIAIHLARGTRIALAPAVLASIYRDLTLLKAVKFDHDHEEGGVLELTLWSPFQLVQLWAWERFPALQPNPNSLKEGDTRSARWHKVTKLQVENVSSVLDSASENFLWRPYTKIVDNWEFHKFYKEHEGWVSVNPESADEFLSFMHCVRVSLLVGLDNVEQYLPHRVAMQFGFDQDVPRDVPQADETREIAWSNYCKPINSKLYIPPRLLESDVTVKYSKWWKQSVSCQEDATESALQQPISSKRLEVLETPSLDDKAIGDAKLCARKSQMSKTMSKAPMGGSRATVRNTSVSEAAKSSPSKVARSRATARNTSESEAANSAPSKVARSVETVKQSEAAICGSMQSTNEREVMCVDRKAGEGCSYRNQKTGLELEARIGRLEEIFAKLKAEKIGYGLKRDSVGS